MVVYETPNSVEERSDNSGLPNLALFGDVDVDTYFPFVTPWQIGGLHNRKTMWTVERLLPREGLAILYGRYGSQKSFIALHLAYCVALGVPFFGLPTAKGRVLYIAAESPEDYWVRCQGWIAANGPADTADKFIFMPQPLNFLDEEQVRKFVEHDLQKMRFSPRLIIIDPLADCASGGDENGSRDMGKVVSGIQAVARDLSALALVVHHEGKDGQLRGHSILPSAAKTIIRVNARDDGNSVALDVKKQRNGKPIGLRLHSEEITLGNGETTRVLKLAEKQAAGLETKKTDSKTDVALRALRPQMKSAEWQRASGLRGGTFDRTRKKLLDEGRVTKEGDLYSPSAPPQQQPPPPTPHPL